MIHVNQPANVDDSTATSPTPYSRSLAWFLIIVGSLLLLATMLMAIARRDVPIPDVPDSEPWFSGVFNALGTLSLLTTGGYLTLRMPRNYLAWLMLLAGFGYALHLFAIGYTYINYLVTPLPSTELMFVLAAIGLGLLLPTIAMIVLLFPSGRLPSSRWRFAWWVWLFVIVFFGGFSWLSPSGRWVAFENPLAIEGSLGERLGLIGAIAWLLFLGLMAIATVSAIIRGLRSKGQERQQFKWLVVAAIFFLITIFFPVNLSTGVWDYSIGYYVINMVSISAITPGDCRRRGALSIVGPRSCHSANDPIRSADRYSGAYLFRQHRVIAAAYDTHHRRIRRSRRPVNSVHCCHISSPSASRPEHHRPPLLPQQIRCRESAATVRRYRPR